MKRITVSLFVLVCTLALTLLIGQLATGTSRDAQPIKGRLQWQYASLVIGDSAVDMYWRAGKTSVSSPGDVTRPDLDRSVKEVYAKMGGKEQSPTLGMLLDLIGHDGWEMVSYAHTSAAQVWMFKRPGLD